MHRTSIINDLMHCPVDKVIYESQQYRGKSRERLNEQLRKISAMKLNRGSSTALHITSCPPNCTKALKLLLSPGDLDSNLEL